MKRYTFPAVAYKDEDMFALFVNDLNLVASGASVEEAFEETLIQLKVFLNCSINLDYDVPKASVFADVAKDKSKNVVLLVSEIAGEGEVS